jgi:LPS O-antigen subunit length determinant protein (WzzB/FepE family)
MLKYFKSQKLKPDLPMSLEHIILENTLMRERYEREQKKGMVIGPDINEAELNNLFKVLDSLKEKLNQFDISVDFKTISGNVNFKLRQGNRNPLYRYRFRRALFFILGILLGWVMATLSSL